MSEPMAASGVQGKANVFQLVKNWYILLHAALAIFSPAKPRLEMFFCIVMLWHTMKLSCMSITQDHSKTTYQRSLSRSPGSATSVMHAWDESSRQWWCSCLWCRVCSFLGNLAGALFVVFLTL